MRSGGLRNMRLHFLGGADEIGASCLLVEAGGRRVLIDAGLRMGEARNDRLPDLARATDLGGLDAILLTHAHLDHSGAMPLVHGAYPRAEIHMTAPTASLLQVLLLDAVKVMESRSEREDEIPLYPKAAVEAFLGRTAGHPFLEPFALCSGDLEATFFPAGHVLGASAIGLQTPEGNLLVTGDASMVDQLTVPGMPRPRFSPHVMVCESTYGARLHASRRAEEERLALTVLDAVRAGKKVLIPAFALGRAQEVLLILRRALARQDAPRITVYADGMVRRICGIYEMHPEALSQTLRSRQQAGRGLFYTAEGSVRPVKDPDERKEILAGPPCVIVSSSGMLAGGPSSFYARQMVKEENALITITGYQDEEAPGRRLQEIAAGASRELVLDGVRTKVNCRVETYALSAHADAAELAGLAAALGPRAVALVHGDGDARRGLAQRLAERKVREVYLPAAGETIECECAPVRRRRGILGIGGGRPLDEAALERLQRHLWDEGPRGRTYSAADLAGAWYGSEGIPVDLTTVHDLLALSCARFAPDPRRPFLFRPVDPEAKADPEPAGDAPLRDEAGRMEQNTALAKTDALFGPDSGLYRKGADREQWDLRLFFRFPDVARKRYGAQLEELARETGWAVKIHAQAHAASLEQAARQVLGPECKPLGNPSIHMEDRTVKVTVASPPLPEEEREMAARFEEETGFSLVLQHDIPGTPRAKKTLDGEGRMEINLVYAEVDRAFEGREVRPLKKGRTMEEGRPVADRSFIAP